MQTFLPYPDFSKSAECLDRARLGKQRSEAKTILNILLGKAKSKAWRNHPAVRMWQGYEGALADYGTAICREWRRRGYKDSLLPFFLARKRKWERPFWLGNPKLHKSHRSNLRRKDSEHYRFRVRDDLGYYWPKKSS